MTVLDQLSDAQRLLIASLPYRVGLWVSHSDSSGGENSEQQERDVLKNLIHGFSNEVFGSELLQYIMADTVAQQDKWLEWEKDIEDIPEECEAAVDILRSYVDDKDVNAYTTRLMEIGEAVALAFREHDYNLSPFKKAKLYLEYLYLRQRAKKHQPQVHSFEQFLYISPHERRALSIIAKRLGALYL